MTVEQRLDQLEKRNKRPTVALAMMAMVATIQLSACGDDPAGPSTNCDVSDVGALAGRNLSECDLEGAILEGANLNGANLRGAKLEGAKLGGANLESANLESVNLESANLENAILRLANLEGANLEGANLNGACNHPLN